MTPLPLLVSVVRAETESGSAPRVEQDVEPALARRKLLGGLPDLAQIGQVELEVLDPALSLGRGDLLLQAGDCLLGLFRRPRGDIDLCTLVQEDPGRLETDARVGAYPRDEPSACSKAEGRERADR